MSQLGVFWPPEQRGLGPLGACGDELMRERQQQTTTVLEYFCFDGSVREGHSKYETGTRNVKKAYPRNIGIVTRSASAWASRPLKTQLVSRIYLGADAR